MRVFATLLVLLWLAGCQVQPYRDDSAQAPTAMIHEGGPATATPSPDAPPPADRELGTETYSPEEIAAVASQFFGETSANIALAIEQVFSDYGRPNAYIVGKEGGGAIVVGVRYGNGTLTYKGGDSMPVYWQGPSIGWDFGGSGSKVFTLVYNLRSTYELFQRFPAIDGSLYVIAGVGVNYQRSGDITLAPMRSGVGLRAGASLGYVHYTREPSVIPF